MKPEKPTTGQSETSSRRFFRKSVEENIRLGWRRNHLLACLLESLNYLVMNSPSHELLIFLIDCFQYTFNFILSLCNKSLIYVQKYFAFCLLLKTRNIRGNRNTRTIYNVFPTFRCNLTCVPGPLKIVQHQRGIQHSLSFYVSFFPKK